MSNLLEHDIAVFRIREFYDYHSTYIHDEVTYLISSFPVTTHATTIIFRKLEAVYMKIGFKERNYYMYLYDENLNVKACILLF